MLPVHVSPKFFNDLFVEKYLAGRWAHSWLKDIRVSLETAWSREVSLLQVERRFSAIILDMSDVDYDKSDSGSDPSSSDSDCRKLQGLSRTTPLARSVCEAATTVRLTAHHALRWLGFRGDQGPRMGVRARGEDRWKSCHGRQVRGRDMPNTTAV